MILVVQDLENWKMMIEPQTELDLGSMELDLRSMELDLRLMVEDQLPE